MPLFARAGVYATPHGLRRIVRSDGARMNGVRRRVDRRPACAITPKELGLLPGCGRCGRAREHMSLATVPIGSPYNGGGTPTRTKPAMAGPPRSFGHVASCNCFGGRGRRCRSDPRSRASPNGAIPIYPAAADRAAAIILGARLWDLWASLPGPRIFLAPQVASLDALRADASWAGCRRTARPSRLQYLQRPRFALHAGWLASRDRRKPARRLHGPMRELKSFFGGPYSRSEAKSKQTPGRLCVRPAYILPLPH